MRQTVLAFKFIRLIYSVMVVSIALSLAILKPTRQVNAEEVGIDAAQKKDISAKPIDGKKLNNQAAAISTEASSIWSTWFMPKYPTGRANRRFTTDLNGDGILDYIVISRVNSDSWTIAAHDKVYIGNGHGWNLVNDSYSSSPNYYDGCFKNYVSWSHSTKYNPNTNWNSFDLSISLDWEKAKPEGDTVFEFLTDLNGDGLPDYIWNEILNYGSPSFIQRNCVYINNGHGWDAAYRCVAQQGYYVVDYYGDCADLTQQSIKQSSQNPEKSVKLETKISPK